ncbi:MAG: glycosyltransferase family 4 protein [Deltaproteobacteria bacterium]|nr:glycosyltransferase family 4 protein [Deltaproteobacteria bacterium]
MKKLLFIINDPFFFISHRLPIALEAKKRGYIVMIAAPYNKDAEKILTEKGFAFYPVKLSRSGVNLFEELKTIIELYKLYREIRPDIIHNVTIKPVLYGGILAKITKIPAVVSAITGLGFVFISKGFFANIRRFLIIFIYRIALSHKNLKVIFQNPDDLNMFIEKKLIKKDQAELILGSGVDTSEFYPSFEPKTKPAVITMASRMLWDKGVGEFIAAAEYLKEKGVYAKFFLAGDTDSGNPASVSEKQLKKWHDKNIVEWLGFKKDIRKIFEMSNVVCLPSYREGLPKVLIEAASCGKPIITTDVSGCKEIVKHGKNGLLVPAKDYIALASAMERLINDKEMRIKMGKEGRSIAEADFKIESVVEKTIAIYNRL